MNKKIGFFGILLTLIVVGISQVYLAHAQELGASLPDLNAKAGRSVTVSLNLTDNTLAAQSGINILFNPDIAFIKDLRRDIVPGRDLKRSDFFLVPGVKDRSVQDLVNRRGLFLGIFPKFFPAPIIPNGEIVRIRFSIKDDVKVGDFSNLHFSFFTFNPTSFSTQKGTPISIEKSNFVDGRITVTHRSKRKRKFPRRHINEHRPRQTP